MKKKFCQTDRGTDKVKLHGSLIMMQGPNNQYEYCPNMITYCEPIAHIARHSKDNQTGLAIKHSDHMVQQSTIWSHDSALDHSDYMTQK